MSGSRNSVKGNRQTEIFFIFLGGDFFEIGVFYSLFEHICKKNLFSFTHLVSVFLCYFSLLVFQIPVKVKKKETKQ